jgi:hypothetical protein
VLKYLRANGYRPIVTGGGQTVRCTPGGVRHPRPGRSSAPDAYGYDRNGRPFLTKGKLLLSNNAGKPEGIHR